jgi:hypothetical protein
VIEREGAKDERRKPAKRTPRLFDRVAAILEEARARVVRTGNTRMVVAYWLIGREIVQEEQGGKKRAGYGDALLEDLSRRLTERYGRGYSVTNLKNFRAFHLTYADRLARKGSQPQRPVEILKDPFVLILCTDRNEAMVRYTLPRGQKQIYAARYRTALPSEEELVKLLRRDWDRVVREQGVDYGTR